jgi:NhaP-type Na+/H+ or K+/H+ antiporter
MVVFGGLSIWQVGILAAILAPTDAGLGQIIVRSEQVPARIREALGVEAGLNDGLSVPFLLFFMALATAGGSTEAHLLSLIRDQLGLGALIGAAIGGGGGALLAWSRRRGWTTEELGPIAVVVLPLLCLLAAEGAGASMFIAAFVAGLAVQTTFTHAPRHSVEFAEGWGQLLCYAVFFLFGLLVVQEWRLLDARLFVYAALSLTIVRMLPVALALIGTGLDRATVLFMGWFGPRGLASIVLGLVYLEHQAGVAGAETIRLATMATVLLSIVAHGLTAVPGIGWLRRSET